jgi:redox-sensitive bicupin YhaK (pirin superfamily)
MHKHKVWIEIVIVGTVIACAIALLMAFLGAAAAAGAAVSGRGAQQLPAEPQQPAFNASEQSYEGMVTCSRCGAKHSPRMDRTATNCTRVCVHAGASFELVEAESAYVLEGNLEALKQVAGQRARVIGTRNGDTIKVDAVAPVT